VAAGLRRAALVTPAFEVGLPAPELEYFDDPVSALAWLARP
jgi:hypothetical protein